MSPCTSHSLPDAACRTTSGYCHICQCTTATVIIPLSSGHLGNCCAFCRATRKGRPFISHRELITTNAGNATGHRGLNEVFIRKG